MPPFLRYKAYPYIARPNPVGALNLWGPMAKHLLAVGANTAGPYLP